MPRRPERGNASPPSRPVSREETEAEADYVSFTAGAVAAVIVAEREVGGAGIRQGPQLASPPPHWSIDDCGHSLLMPNHAMRHIRLFQVSHLFRRQFDGQCADGVFQMLGLGGSDDRGCHRRLLQQPG
jgi:hypothetical protein